ncbi:bifunctional isocitrate dehydrogenase kinase/phosphatase [Pendulispora brunnea]|uniref:Bifunctional isocitrate dehydrogenase kinase/phosphatase n=1 Tax=Pendulispora brunnea TaxID=2905690 RepID=A0ABZ2KH55_9BACT
MSASFYIARAILDGFDKHYRLFRETTARAKERFERADWEGGRAAAFARIDMYDQRVREAVEVLAERFPDLGLDDTLWQSIKLSYVGLLHDHKQPECAETFYNSVATRVLDRRYHSNEYIFSRPAVSTEHLDGDEPTYRSYYPAELGDAFRQILLSYDLKSPKFENPFQDLERDVRLMLRAVEEHFPEGWDRQPNFQIQALRSLFFRNKAAYIVGRVLNGNVLIPLMVPILRDEEGRLFVDALLLDKRSIGRVLSLNHVYFMVDMEVPAAYVSFLETVVPQRPRADLYTMVGLQKQGKTLFFRDLQQHLKHSTDTFVLAPGTKGMVMLVFTLPSLPCVFKIIRDWFEPPKDTDRNVVLDRYQLVKHHDRVGRMTDALEFTHVAFPRERFSVEVLEEMERVAPSNVTIEGDRIVLKHIYVERRLVPLDMYIQDANDDELRDVIREYGEAVKDLARANIFPGDLLTKNFGVTRYGRVVFYDYDEICYLTDCRFRSMPKPRDDEEEMANEPWFAVEPNDIFPEQFPMFLFPEGRTREIFLAEHRDLAQARFWIERQAHIREGREEEVFPYGEAHRFANRDHKGG